MKVEGLAPKGAKGIFSCQLVGYKSPPEQVISQVYRHLFLVCFSIREKLIFLKNEEFQNPWMVLSIEWLW